MNYLKQRIEKAAKKYAPVIDDHKSLLRAPTTVFDFRIEHRMSYEHGARFGFEEAIRMLRSHKASSHNKTFGNIAGLAPQDWADWLQSQLDGKE